MRYGTAQSFEVFVRNWWVNNPSWPNGLKPGPGRSTTIAKGCTEAEAQAICREWNATHKPGRLCRKAEYTREVRSPAMRTRPALAFNSADTINWRNPR
jgi:hypothetical protein